MTFMQSASRLVGLTALLLGWRPEDFWRATPAELAAIWEAARGDGADPGIAPDMIARLQEMYPDG
jgi:hypothetical protein